MHFYLLAACLFHCIDFVPLIFDSIQILKMRNLFFQKLDLHDETRLSGVKSQDFGATDTGRTATDDLVVVESTVNTVNSTKNIKMKQSAGSVYDKNTTSTAHTASRKPIMMLLKRSAGAKHTRNRFDVRAIVL